MPASNAGRHRAIRCKYALGRASLACALSASIPFALTHEKVSWSLTSRSFMTTMALLPISE